MEVQYVREFLTLVKYGNYLAAADELFISQSTLSKHIFALEKELGLSLLNRTTRKVQLNQYGAAFLPYAQKMVEADSDFRNNHQGQYPSWRASGFSRLPHRGCCY